MAILTKKFSEFANGGDLPNDAITVGLGVGGNTQYNNPWTFLPPGTTGDRPVPVPAIYFRLRYNTSLDTYEYYDPDTMLWIGLSGSGTGTVLPGTTNDLPFYIENGTTLGAIDSAANSILVTNGSSVPSLSTTTPAGLNVASAIITASTAALTSGQVAAVPSASTDLVNKTYVDTLVGGTVLSITGTTNQVIASSPTGNVTLSLPQSIGTGSSPTFASLTLSSPLMGASGGSGVANTGTTFTRGGNVTFAGAFPFTGTLTASTAVTFPTSGLLAAYDANNNLSANNFIPGYATTVTAAGTTTLTVTSAQQQFFTGVTTQTVVLPVTSTLVLGFSYLIVNDSTGIVTVQSSGLNNVVAVAPSTQTRVTCILTSGTTAASWSADATATIAGVSSITGTANQVIASSATGNVTLSLPQSINTTATPIFAGFNDANGLPELRFTTTPGSNNYFNMQNAVGSPVLSIAGLSPNAGMTFAVKGLAAFSFQTEASANIINIYSGTGLQHTTAFSFANTAATQFVTFPDATGTLLMTGQAINSVPSIAFNSTSGIIGTTTNNNAAAGSAGEYVEVIVNSGSAVSLTTGAPANVALMNLTQGDWEVFGYVGFTGTATSTSSFSAGISQTSATLPSRTAIQGSESSAVIATSSGAFASVGHTIVSLTPTRVSIATGATVTQCLVAQLSFGGGTGTAYGTIRARRIR